MVEVNSENFSREVLGPEGVVVVDFWAPWCVPCKVLAPVLDRISEEQKSQKARAKVVKVNVDENPQLATELSIFNIPTLVFFKKGKEESRLIGVNTKEAIEARIDKIISEA